MYDKNCTHNVSWCKMQSNARQQRYGVNILCILWVIEDIHELIANELRDWRMGTQLVSIKQLTSRTLGCHKASAAAVASEWFRRDRFASTSWKRTC